MTLDFFGFPPCQNLNVTGHLFSRAALACAQFDVPSYQLISTCKRMAGRLVLGEGYERPPREGYGAAYFNHGLQVLHLPSRQDLQMTRDLLARSVLARPQFDVPSYQLIATWKQGR